MSKHEALSIIELQNLRADVEQLLRGEKTLSELVFEVKHMFLPNSYLPKFILEKGGIGIGNQYGFGVDYTLKFNEDPPAALIPYCFRKPVGIFAIALICQLLDDRTMRKHVIDHLVFTWKPAYTEWLAEFVNALDERGLMHLIIEPILKDTCKFNTRTLRKNIVQLVGDEKMTGVIQAAERARKMASLYEITRWPACQGRGEHQDRKKMLSIDLNL